MLFEILDKETELAVDKISAQVKRYKNGVVADALKKAGILYEMSYGVSIVDLRKIAANYPPNNNLAKALWRKKWRETMILASLLVEKNKDSMLLLQEFCRGAETEEVLQQLGMNTLSSFKNTHEIIKSFITSNDLNQGVVACYAIAKLYTGNKAGNTNADEFTQLLLKLRIEDNENWVAINALAKALLKVGYVSGIENEEILGFFKERIALSKSWKVAYEMVNTEFEYR